MRSFMSAALGLPSVQQFLATAVQDLAQQRSVLMLLPHGVDVVTVREAVRAMLDHRGFCVQEVDASAGETATPVEVLGNELNVQWPTAPTPRTLACLLQQSSLPDIVCLTGIETLGPEQQSRWSGLVSQWARIAHGRVDNGKRCSSLCIIAPAEKMLTSLPQSDTHLSVLWWWGFPSRLEVQLLCRAEARRENDLTLARWREYVLPALAPADLNLLNHLWDKADAPKTELLAALKDYALSRGWSAENLRSELPAVAPFSWMPDTARDHVSPPTDYIRLWALGALICSEEYGPELHIAACGVLGREGEVRHRIWRGQAELVLPYLDQARARLCYYLARRHGSDWAKDAPSLGIGTGNGDGSADPSEFEWLDICSLLENIDRFARERTCKDLADKARRVRNRLAHSDPVEQRDYRAIIGLVKRLEA